MKALAWVALVVSLVGSMLAISAYWRVRSMTAPAPDADLESLKARVARLERGVAAERAPAPEEGSPPAPPDASPGEVAELKRRIDLLEQRQTPGRFEIPSTGRPVRGSPAVVDAYKKRLMDPSQAERSRAQALLSLRLQGANKADDVVDSGLALLAQAKDPATRALVLRGLQGAENPRVVSPAITLLGSDPDENTRMEAAGILSGYVGQPEVKVALESAASNDAADRVRKRAQSALGQSK